MSEALVFIAGSVVFVLTTTTIFLFLMLRFNEVYESPDGELTELESVAQPDAPGEDVATGPATMDVAPTSA